MIKDTNYVENEIAVDGELTGLQPSDFNYYYEGMSIDKYVYSTTEPRKQVATVVGTDCFTVIPQPDQAYQDSTKKIDITGIPEFTMVPSITDGTQTVTFFDLNMQPVSMIKYTVPISWATWSSPPDSESATPPVLYSNGLDSITMTLSKPVCTFGFELEPNLRMIFSYTVEFYSGTDLVGSITQDVNGDFGARLFAAKTCCCTAFDRVVITAEQPSFGFAIAQVRYSTDCSSHCECCCEEPVPVTFEGCQDLQIVPITVADLSCEGRMLIVDVTVTACENRKVAVGVLICNDEETKPLRFKVCEACMPESTDPRIHCVRHTFRFCFIFETNLCSPLSLNVKTFAEYACFDFPCNCEN